MILTGILILLGYCLSAWLIFNNLDKPRTQYWVQLTPASLAILVEIPLLKTQIYPEPGVMNLGFFIALALISWLVSIQILISSLYRPLHSLGVAMFPFSGIAAVIPLLMNTQGTLHTVSSPYIQGHIMLSVIAYSLLMLGALQSVVLAYQEHAIRSHHPGGLVRFLPPLHDMETLLFQILGFGFIFLTSALVSGFFFVEDLFAQHLAHKTVLSIIGWGILATLLYGRYQFGWRGKTAVRWTLAAFLLLMLAYFGSKLVLEFIFVPTT